MNQIDELIEVYKRLESVIGLIDANLKRINLVEARLDILRAEVEQFKRETLPKQEEEADQEVIQEVGRNYYPDHKELEDRERDHDRKHP